MAKKPKKYLRSDFGPRKRHLPKALEFLESFNFHAVTEDTSGEKIKRIIEVKPSSLKKLIQASEIAEGIIQENNEITLENEELKKKLEAAIEHIRKLEYNNSILIERLNERPDVPHERSPRSYFNVIEDSGFKPIGLPLQGGLPSLGKRK